MGHKYGTILLNKRRCEKRVVFEIRADMYI